MQKQAVIVSSLLHWRIQRGWSRAELAAQLSISPQTIYAIERNKRNPSLALAIRLSDILDVPIRDLFDSNGHHLDSGLPIDRKAAISRADCGNNKS